MEFVSPDPAALVRAVNVRSTLAAFKLAPAAGARIIERHRLMVEDLTPTRFMLVQPWLDALKEIQLELGAPRLREVGRQIVETAVIPEGDTESILLDLDRIYYLNHRGDVGHYRSRRKASNVIEICCETPYPRNFEWGLIEGFSRNKCARGNRYQIEYIDGPATGALTCTLLVHRLP